MTSGSEPRGQEVDPDDLRRRLYRSDATEEDVQRYLAGRAEQPEGRPTDRDEREPVRRRPRRALVIGLAVAAAAALLVALQAQRTPSDLDATGPEGARVEDVGDGEVLDVTRGEVSDGRAAPTSVRGTAVVGRRFEGSGNAIVPFDPPAGTREGGRAMVAVTSLGTATVRWRALLTVDRGGRSSGPLALARGIDDRQLGRTPTTFVYPSSPPDRVAVEAPEGARWTLVIAATDGIEPVLR